ncbi:hypothetical protein F5146DRAFT_1118497 [Armillaria mellea]|nr:hypothetical protein F5146DRAFT_1118497 [Armillaria mellea]
MSFYDGVSIASVFDGAEMSDIVKLLRDHDIYMGQSIMNEREYLYYFIRNCNVAQQTAIRNDGRWRFHHVEQLCQIVDIVAGLITVLDVAITTLHSRRQLLKELNNYDLEALVRDRGWNTDNPIFVDGTSVTTTLRIHHKDVLLDALRLRMTAKQGIKVVNRRPLVTMNFNIYREPRSGPPRVQVGWLVANSFLWRLLPFLRFNVNYGLLTTEFWANVSRPCAWYLGIRVEAFLAVL